MKAKDVLKTSSVRLRQDECLLGIFPDIYNSFMCIIKYFENAMWSVKPKYQENRKNKKWKNVQTSGCTFHYNVLCL